MRTKAVLLQSVSALATVAANTGHAQAQVVTPSADGYTYNIGGGLLFSQAESSLAGLEQEKLGSAGITYTDLDEFDDHFGYNAFFSVGKQIDNTWDIRVGGSINKLLDSTGSLYWSGGDSGFSSGSGGAFSSYSYGSYGSATGRDSFGFAAMDFEVGYTPVLSDGMSVRLFAGIRGLHFAADSDQTESISFFESGASSAGFGSGFSSGFFGLSFFGQEHMKSEFFGAGPRIGASVAKRFEGTNFGVSGQIAGAVLFGRQTTTWNGTVGSSFYSSYYASSGGPGSAAVSGSDSGSNTSAFSSSYSVDKMVVDLQAKAGIDYYLDDSTALTVGYQAEKLFNVGPYDDQDESRLVHGPFLALTGSF